MRKKIKLNFFTKISLSMFLLIAIIVGNNSIIRTQATGSGGNLGNSNPLGQLDSTISYAGCNIGNNDNSIWAASEGKSPYSITPAFFGGIQDGATWVDTIYYYNNSNKYNIITNDGTNIKVPWKFWQQNYGGEYTYSAAGGLNVARRDIPAGNFWEQPGGSFKLEEISYRRCSPNNITPRTILYTYTSSSGITGAIGTSTISTSELGSDSLIQSSKVSRSYGDNNKIYYLFLRRLTIPTPTTKPATNTATPSTSCTGASKTFSFAGASSLPTVGSIVEIPGGRGLVTNVSPELGANNVTVLMCQSNTTTPNTAPTQPTVSAPEYVKSGEQFSIFASTADANGDNVRYNVDWKAGSPITGTSPSSGYVPPTTNTEAGHSYTIPISTNITKYTIQVSATDNNTSPKTSATTTKDIIVYNCSAGYYFNTTNKTCTKCSANSYSSAGAITCTQCTPQGATSPAGSTSASACVVPNTAPETPIVTPTTCDPGQEPSPSGTGCTKCLQGTYSSDGKRCVECPNGQTSFEGASRCSTLLDICPAPNTCQKGYERVNGTCNKCLQGTYSPNGLKCLPCDNGKTSFEGAAECTILPGTCPKPPVITDPICLTNETWNGSSCVRNGGGGGGGESCKLGQYISGSTCLDCPAGTFGANPPGNGLGSCRYCPSNTYSIAGSASCIACSSVQTWNGYSCVDNTVYKTPITNCKPGQELSADKECTKCSAGYGSLGDECIEIIKYLYANPNKVLQGAKSKLYYEIINDDETKKIIEGISKCKITDITTPANTLSAISIAKGSVETSQITDPTKYELSCPNTTPRTTNVNIYSRGEV